MTENVSLARFNLGLISKCLVILSCTTLPTLVLLLLLYFTRLPHNDPNAVYSHLGVTRILIPSTITSTLAVIAASDTLRLTSFSSAWHWLRPREGHTLPSPQEVQIASSITFKPDISSVFSFLKLLFGRRHPKTKDHQTRQVSSVLLFPGSVAGLVLFLSWSISACDYWIHSTASSVSISIPQSDMPVGNHSLPAPARNASLTWNKSKDAFHSYFVNGTTVQLSSNLDLFQNDTYIAPGAFRQNLSFTLRLYYNHTDYIIYNVDNRHAFIGRQPFRGNNLTISARSMAVQTSCYDMTQLCQYDKHMWICPGGNTTLVLPDIDIRYSATTSFLVLVNGTSGQDIPFGSGMNPMSYAVGCFESWHFCQTTAGYMNYSLSGATLLSTKFDPLPENAPEAWQISSVLALWSASPWSVLHITRTAINPDSASSDDGISAAMSATLLSYVAGGLDFHPADSWSVSYLAARIPIAPLVVFTSLGALCTDC